MNKGMKKRWISLYVENQVGVLSKISGLFSAKSYNLDSLTVGTTEDPTVSRMTIATVSDDETFEQIKKPAEPHGRGHQSYRLHRRVCAHERDSVYQGIQLQRS